MMKRTVQYLSILALEIGCLSVPRAVEASFIRYDMIDYFPGTVEDPPGNFRPVVPLDKGFAISGYLTVEVPSFPPTPPGFTEDDDDANEQHRFSFCRPSYDGRFFIRPDLASRCCRCPVRR